MTMAKGTGARLTVIGRTFWTEAPLESTNLNSVFVGPPVALVGVPVMAPVEGFKERPVGSCGDPAARLQVYDGEPPEGVSVIL